MGCKVLNKWWSIKVTYIRLHGAGMKGKKADFGGFVVLFEMITLSIMIQIYSSECLL